MGVHVKNDLREREDQVVAMARSGVSIRGIRSAAKMRHETIVEILARHGVRVSNEAADLAREYSAKLAGITEDQWRRWSRNRVLLQDAAREAGVPRDSMRKHASRVGRVWWKGAEQRRTGRTEGQANAQKKMRAIALSGPKESPARPTREDYAELCRIEFATPPYLRQAPAMLAEIEAREAADRKARNSRHQRKAAAS